MDRVSLDVAEVDLGGVVCDVIARFGAGSGARRVLGLAEDQRPERGPLGSLPRRPDRHEPRRQRDQVRRGQARRGRARRGGRDNAVVGEGSQDRRRPGAPGSGSSIASSAPCPTGITAGWGWAFMSAIGSRRRTAARSVCRERARRQRHVHRRAPRRRTAGVLRARRLSRTIRVGSCASGGSSRPR